MPKVTVTHAFHYAKGGEVLRFTKGEQELAPDVLEHATKNGFIKQATQQPKAVPTPATLKDAH